MVTGRGRQRGCNGGGEVQAQSSKRGRSMSREKKKEDARGERGKS